MLGSIKVSYAAPSKLLVIPERKLLFRMCTKNCRLTLAAVVNVNRAMNVHSSTYIIIPRMEVTPGDITTVVDTVIRWREIRGAMAVAMAVIERRVMEMPARAISSRPAALATKYT